MTRFPGGDGYFVRTTDGKRIGPMQCSHVRPGASVLHAQAACTGLPRVVRTRGAGQVAHHCVRTSGVPYVPRAVWCTPGPMTIPNVFYYSTTRPDDGARVQHRANDQ